MLICVNSCFLSNKYKDIFVVKGSCEVEVINIHTGSKEVETRECTKFSAVKLEKDCTYEITTTTVDLLGEKFTYISNAVKQ